MSHQAIHLFGGFQVELNGRPLTNFGTDKTRALLSYLALESDRPHRREALANLFWCERPQAAALHSLRQALYQLHSTLCNSSKYESYLIITSNQVQFNPASDHWIDVAEFLRRISACSSHHPASVGLCNDCMKSLQTAVELYRGELLEGFTLPDCEQFTDWQVINQECCHRQMMLALSLLADDYEANLEYGRLLACALRMVELEPWHELSHRLLMWVMAKVGQREGALRQYEILRKILQRELAITPMPETVQLYEQIRKNHLPSYAIQWLGEKATSQL